ncbi:MAG TPA: DUF3846 domain-containing protein [Acetobacteraceae bacterium]|jgi:hypothetical protein|nr:DUF3846 domain-containing protein [Acetobacteraceae bacterium]
MKAILIDASARRFRPVEYAALPDLQRLVGGYIEAVPVALKDDTLYVDEEGLKKPQSAFFAVEGYPQPLAGTGVLVGHELFDDEGDFLGTADPSMTIEALRGLIRFFTRSQVDAWGKANASDTASAVTIIRRGSHVSHEVLQRYGSVIESIPRPKRSSYGWTTSQGCIVVTDLDEGGLSVTNDIERVIEDLVAAGADVDQPIVYRDSTGKWDGVLTEHGRFKDFLPFSEPSATEAIATWRRLAEIKRRSQA